MRKSFEQDSLKELVLSMNGFLGFSLGLVFLLLASSCQRECLPFQESLKEHCGENNTEYLFQLDTMISHPWEKLYVIQGPRFPSEVSDILDLPYNSVISDNTSQYIFLHGGSISKEHNIRCQDISFFNRSITGNGYFVLTPSTLLTVEKIMSQGNTYYRVEYPDKE